MDQLSKRSTDHPTDPTTHKSRQTATELRAQAERGQNKPSAFMEAAGMVLTIGLGVLRLVGKGIKGATNLLIKPASGKVPAQHNANRTISTTPGTMKASAASQVPTNNEQLNKDVLP
jgi:hypothetical protein